MWEKINKNLIAPDQIAFYAISTSAVLTLVILILVGITYRSLPNQLPLFYSLPWGDTQLGSITQFLILPASAVFITLVNLAISWHLHSSQVLLKRFLSISSALISLLIFITTLRIIFIFI